jgi:preprotein translocase subunit SecE
MADRIKVGLAVLLFVAGLAGFYLLADAPLVARIGSILLGLVLGLVTAWFSEPGRRFISYAREALAETRKVHWPTRKETVQMTAIVFGFVLIMAIFLWLTDKSIEWILYDLILGWR